MMLGLGSLQANASDVWHSYDAVVTGGSPQATLNSAANDKPTYLEFYQSTNDGGVAKNLLFNAFNNTHPNAFNHVESVWSIAGGSEAYPYAGKSTVNRGADSGETNTPLPTGVRDLQLHPSDSARLTVAAFHVPADGAYEISNLAVRRVDANGSTVRLRVFNSQGTQVANLQATNNRAWVTGSTVNLGTLEQGDFIYFAVDSDGDYSFDATEIAWDIQATSASAPVWNSYDVALQTTGLPQATVPSTDASQSATVEFYESTNNGGVAKGSLFNTYSASHPHAFNHVGAIWSNGAGTTYYPYAGKSSVGRGSDTGEANSLAPAGVLDLQLHPSDSQHLTVAAFKAPVAGHYEVSGLGVRRVDANGTTVHLRLFNKAGTEVANLQASNNRAWVNSVSTYDLGTLAVGEYVYFAVDGDGDYSFDATEISWTITVQGAAPVVGAMKFHPGTYLFDDTYHPLNGGPDADGRTEMEKRLDFMDRYCDNPNIAGFQVISEWPGLEGNTAGDYTQGIANVQLLLNKAGSCGKHLLLGILPMHGGGTGSDLSLYFPEYLWTTAGTGPRGSPGQPGYNANAVGFGTSNPYGLTSLTREGVERGITTRIWQPATAARLKALGAAYGAAFDQNPFFEGVVTGETSLNVEDNRNGYSVDALEIQLFDVLASWRASMPTTQIRLAANDFWPDSRMLRLLDLAEELDLSVGGPDIRYDDVTQADRVYVGLDRYGNAPFPDRRGVVPWMAEVQSPEMNIWSAAELLDNALNGYTATREVYLNPATDEPTGVHFVMPSVRPMYLIWSIQNYSDNLQARYPAVEALIDSTQGHLYYGAPASVPCPATFSHGCKRD